MASPVKNEMGTLYSRVLFLVVHKLFTSLSVKCYFYHCETKGAVLW